MPPEAPGPRCASHPAADAVHTCQRCGRFACAACARTESGVVLCLACLARPEARLTPSPRAKRALAMGLVGLHGVVVLLPIAAWLARAELRAIEAGDAPPAGKPWAQGALAASIAGALLWLVLAVVLLGE